MEVGSFVDADGCVQRRIANHMAQLIIAVMHDAITTGSKGIHEILLITENKDAFTGFNGKRDLASVEFRREKMSVGSFVHDKQVFFHSGHGFANLKKKITFKRM
jgi:hypothetical protein